MKAVDKRLADVFRKAIYPNLPNYRAGVAWRIDGSCPVTGGLNLKSARRRLHADDVFLGSARMTCREPIVCAMTGRRWPRGGPANCWRSIRSSCSGRRADGIDAAAGSGVRASNGSRPGVLALPSQTACAGVTPRYRLRALGHVGGSGATRGGRPRMARGAVDVLSSKSAHLQVEPENLSAFWALSNAGKPACQANLRLVTRHGVSGRSSTK